MLQTRTWIEISKRAVIHNLNLVKQLAYPADVMCVVKANSYGCEAEIITKICADMGISRFGVATVDEALNLKRLRLNLHILGTLTPSEYEYAVKNDFICPVVDEASAKKIQIACERLRKYARIHFLIDTGMGRLGFLPSDSGKVLDFIEKRKIKPPAGVISHLSSADEDEDYTSLQVESYYRLLKFFESRFGRMKRQIANSAYLLLNGYEERMGIVRLGIAIYGASPSKDLSTSLEECMSFESIIWQVKRMKKGSRISYGGEAVLGRDSIIGVVPVGYAHGYPRVVTGKAKVIVKGRKVPVVGRVTMDWIMVDLTDVGWLEKGEVVTIMGKSGGESISSWDIATWSGTIPYEIFYTKDVECYRGDTTTHCLRYGEAKSFYIWVYMQINI